MLTLVVTSVNLAIVDNRISRLAQEAFCSLEYITFVRQFANQKVKNLILILIFIADVL